MFTLAISFDHFQFPLIHGPYIPGSYAILLFTASELASITSPIHNWMLFLLWLQAFILSGVISPVISSSILGTYWPGSSSFNVLPFAFSYCSWVSQGKNTVVVCHSLLQIANIRWIIEKAREFQKTSISALLTMPKPLTVWITTNFGKFWKRWEYQATWPASWETCIQVRKQQLELDMEQQTGSK